MDQTKRALKISPHDAHEKMQGGAVLLDVREYPEWIESHIAGATLMPLGDVKRNPQSAAMGDEVIVFCRTDKRATEAAQALVEAGVATPYVMEGGIEEWRAAGLPTQKAVEGPIALERQVRIGAGSLVLLGLLVPRLRPISYFVGAGLVLAGISDWCGMGTLLSKGPWNRPRGDEKERSRQWQHEHASKVEAPVEGA